MSYQAAETFLMKH